jgi:hypothetical protein
VKRTIILIAVSALLLYSAQSFATYYKWTDEKGKVWITDYPNPKKANKKADTAKAKDKDDTQQSLADLEGRVLKKSENSSSFLVTEDIRRKIEGISGADLSSVSASTISVIVILVLVLLVVLYLYFALCLFLIARRLAISNAWIAFAPVVNLLILIRSAGKPQWWMAIMVVLMLLTVMPVFGILFSLMFDVLFVYLWMCVTNNLGKNKWLGLLMIVPVVNIIYPGCLAFVKDRAPSETEAEAEAVTAITNAPGETMQDFSSDRQP